MPMYGKRCRRCERTNAAPRGLARRTCFPALPIVRTVEKSSITVRAKTLKRGKTISFAPIHGKRVRKPALHISLVLWHLQHITSFVTAYEELFRMKMTAKRTVERKKQSALLRKQIAQAERRLGELSKLFKRMYEDNVNGKLNDIRFEELSADYETEQEDLESKLEQWQAESKEQEQHAEDVERFIRKCKQYTDISKLTSTILNDLVCKVLVEAPNKSSGKRKQNIHISYDLLGILPELNTSVNEEMA